jgi:hypothetical protein
MAYSRYAAAVALSGLLIAGCGGGDNGATGPGDTPSDPQLPQPNPANVIPNMDPARMASARIPVSGGTLQTTGADGTVYTLTIPPNALTSDTTISMTPLTGVSGLDLSGGHLLGVQFAPEGLSFLHEVTFRIDPPEGARHSALGLVAHGDGTEIHRYPLTPNPDLLELPMLHFTLGAVLVYSSDNPNLGPVADILPSDPEDRLSTLLGDIWRNERERALQGLEPDPELGDKLQTILQAFYDEVIEPSFNAMRTDCSAAQTLAPRAIRWERSVELMGLHNDFGAQEGAVHEAVVAALENCFNTTKGECLDTSDPVQMNEAAAYTRQLALFGVEDPQYNFLNPDLHCSLGWSGTVTSTAQLEKSDGSEVTDIITTDVQWVIDTANTYPGVQTRYQVKRGTISWEQKGTDQFGCTHQGGPQSFDLAPEDGEIVVDEINHTYQATGVTMHFTRVSVTCPPGQPSYTSDVSVSTWLITPVTPFPGNATELSGAYEYPGLNTTFVWDFNR